MRFKLALVINAPAIFDLFWNIILPLLKPKARERVSSIYVDNVKNALYCKTGNFSDRKL